MYSIFISALQGFGVSSYFRDLHNSENFWCKVHSFVFSLSKQSLSVLDVRLYLGSLCRLSGYFQVLSVH